MSSQRDIRATGFSWARIAAGALAMLPATAIAAEERYPSAVRAMLPAYCHQEVTGRGFSREEAERWSKALREGFPHIHHYCRGLGYTYKGLLVTFNATQRRRALQFSLDEFDYILRNTGKDWVLRPEVLTKKGENLIFLSRPTEGVPTLQQAIEIKADYWPPYAALSDYYKATGDRAKAREYVQKALAFAPNVKALNQRLAELDPAAARSGVAHPAPKPAKPQTEQSGREVEMQSEKSAPDPEAPSGQPTTPADR